MERLPGQPENQRRFLGEVLGKHRAGESCSRKKEQCGKGPQTEGLVPEARAIDDPAEATVRPPLPSQCLDAEASSLLLADVRDSPSHKARKRLWDRNFTRAGTGSAWLNSETLAPNPVLCINVSSELRVLCGRKPGEGRDSTEGSAL